MRWTRARGSAILAVAKKGRGRAEREGVPQGMDTLLIVTERDGFYERLRRSLAGDYEICRSRTLDGVQPLVDRGRVSVLLVDCPADDGPLCAFFRHNELTHPHLECTAVMEPESFCRLALSKSHNLLPLLRPVETQDVVRVLRETKVKLARDAALPPVSDPVFVRRQEQRFWLTLIHSGQTGSGPEAPGPAPFTFSFEPDRPILPLLVCFRGWRRAPASRREQEVLRFGLRAYLEQTLPQQYGGVALGLDDDSTLVILYGDRLPGAEELRRLCRNVIHIADQGLHCNVSCYCGEVCLIRQAAAQVQTLVEGDRNNVVENQGMFSLARLREERPPLSAPMPQNWMIFFNQGRLEDFCRCVDEFFQQAMAANALDRDFLAGFQQDLAQELGFALKSAGVPARRLFHGSRGAEEMRDAVRSVPAMERWVRQVAEEAMVLTGAASENPDPAETIVKYIQVNLERPISRADLSKVFHLSQGHIARIFHKKTGMSISEYVTSQRMEMACRMLVQSTLPPGIVAQRCGYGDYPYFYRIFKKTTGLSPSAYRMQMHE